MINAGMNDASFDPASGRIEALLEQPITDPLHWISWVQSPLPNQVE